MSSKATSAAAGQVCRHHIIVEGKVQGVFYRKHTQKAAKEAGVTGWVRNLPNGTVEIVAEGTRTQVRQLAAWCHTGSPKSSVTAVTVTDLLAAEPETHAEAKADEKKVPVVHREFSSFEVRR